MPLIVATPITLQGPVLADEFIITAVSIVERNISTGMPLTAPLVEISWVKRRNSQVMQSGITAVDGASLGKTQADGALDIRGNLKRLLYGALQNEGVFPPGTVT